MENQKPKSSKRPREMSSKNPVSKFRKVIEVGKSKNFDPRFQPECGGDFDDIKFRKNYNFLDNLRSKEILELKQEYRNAIKQKMPQERIERIQKNYLRLENQQKSSRNARLQHNLNAEIRQENIDRMNRGERPVYYNNVEIKKRFTEKSIEALRQEKKDASKQKRKFKKHVANNCL